MASVTVAVALHGIVPFAAAGLPIRRPGARHFFSIRS